MWFDSQTKGKASSFITSAGPLCTSILGVIVPILAIAHSWRAPFYVFGSVNLVLSLIIFATTGDGKGNKNLSSSLGSGPKPSGATEAEPQGRVKAKDVLRMRGIWHIATLNILFLMSSLCISTFLVAYLVERGLQTTEAGVGFSVLSAASFAGMYLWGVLSDHMQRKYILVASTFLSVAFTSVFLTFQMNMLSTFLLVGLIGVSTGIAPVFFAVISDYFNFKVVGTATGVIFAMLGVGFILAPLIAGHLAYVTGSFASVFRLSIVLAGASSVLAMLLKRSPRKTS
jgi:MFS family permease